MIRSILLGLITLGLLAPGSRGQEDGKKLAVLIGVKDYDHSGFSNLAYTENDVVELEKVLRPEGFEVALLTNSTGKNDPKLLPTRKNILEQLDAMLERCKRNDMLIVGFAGHGVQFKDEKASYFCPVDSRPNRPESMVSLKALYEKLENCGAGVKLVLVDACRVEVARERGIDGDNAAPPPKGVSVFFSCKAGQAAIEANDLRHGLFFYHVIQGLKGKAKNDEGSIAWQDLASYAARKVQGAGYGQVPVLKGEIEGVPILVRSVLGEKVETGKIKPLDIPPKKGTITSKSITFQARHGLSEANYQAWVSSLVAEGLRPNFVSVIGTTQGPYFSAVAVQSKYGWYARHNLTSDGFLQANAKFSEEGFRLISMSGYVHNATINFAGIWVKDDRQTAQEYRQGMTSQEYQATVTDFKKQGYRPIHLNGYPVGNSYRLSAIFYPDQGGGWVARHDLTAQQYQAVFDEYIPKGYRPTSIAAYPNGSETRFGLTMVHDEKTRWESRFNLTSAQYQEKFDTLTPQGYIPIQVIGYFSGGEMRYAAIFLKP